MIPVSVRIGQRVDVVGKSGDPKTITRGHVHTTPVLMSFEETAELVNNDEYEALSSCLEGIVILKKRQQAN